ncbi:hypothetical protein VTN02DRAFT_1141 [Thermoascus thermophilus]
MAVKSTTPALPVTTVLKTIHWATTAATWKIRDLVGGRRRGDLRGEEPEPELELELQGGCSQEEEGKEAELVRMVRNEYCIGWRNGELYIFFFFYYNYYYYYYFFFSHTISNTYIYIEQHQDLQLREPAMRTRFLGPEDEKDHLHYLQYARYLRDLRYSQYLQRYAQYVQRYQEYLERCADGG